MSIFIIILIIFLALLCGFLIGSKITKKLWSEEYYSMANMYHDILRKNNMEHINRDIISNLLSICLGLSFKDKIKHRLFF